MKSDSEEKAQRTDDLLTAYKSLQQFYDALLKDYGNEKAGKYLWRIVALVFMCLSLINTRTKTLWIPDPNSQDMRVEYSNWWGIEKRTFYPVWRKPSGEDIESWCIKYPDGTWQAFLVDDGESVYCQWPEKNYAPPPKK